MNKSMFSLTNFVAKGAMLALALAVGGMAAPTEAAAQAARPGAAASGASASVGAQSPTRMASIPSQVLPSQVLPTTAVAASALPLQPLGCLIEPSVVVDVGSPVVGVLDTIHVERGDVVRKGQPVARLTDEVERAAAAVAMARMHNEADLMAAQSARDFARRKAERTEMLFKQNMVSSQARDQAETEFRLAEMKIAQAEEQRQQAVQEVKLARAQLATRVINSPVSGVVVERYLSVGERIEEKPVIKIAQVDPLRVDVILPAAMLPQVRRGAAATVTPELAGATARQATITIVDRMVDAASNTFRVRMQMPNPGGALPAGLRCKVAFAGL